MKNNIIKKVLIALHGLFQGFIGLWWSFVGIAFITHPDSSPGTKDWEEDEALIPVGYIMILIYLIILAASFYIFKEKKSDIIAFIISLAVGIAGFVIFVLKIL
ncbi:MAG TPA: hypothetical protein DCG30_04380 [Ruminococcus sp.]|nr:hypothetical protein [Ruminococcus sp.]